MGRLAVLEHHVVRDVDQRRHTALATARQPVDHPRRRWPGRVDVAHDAARKATAQVGRIDLHGQQVVVHRRYRRHDGHHQWSAGQCSQFACHAKNAQAVRKVRREFEREQEVVEIQDLANIGTYRRIGRQFEQAAMVLAELEFARRAQHALALDATQLPELDQERLAIVTGRQLGAHQRARDLDTDARIRCTAHDVEQGALPDIDLAHAQPIGIRMLLGRLDLADHDEAERRCGRLALLDLEPTHGERLGQFGAAERRVAEFAQPGLGKLHLVCSRSYRVARTGSPV